MEWYERWFGEEYLIVYEHRDAAEAEREADTIRRVLNLGGGELVLDLCCGTGRHDVPLVRMGCRVIGLDYSERLLKIARSSRSRGGKYPVYVRADARRTVFRRDSFDVVLNLFTSFGYFEDDENFGFLRSIARVLKPRGRFYIDYLNPPRVLSGLVEESVSLKNGVEVIEKRRYDPDTRRVEKDILLRKEGSELEFRESVRLYGREEMTEMLSGAGLRTEGVLGSAEGEPYGETSERMILFGTKE